MFQLQNGALQRFRFSLWRCHLHPRTCGFLFVKIGFHKMLVFLLWVPSKVAHNAVNIFSGSRVIFADLRIKKGESKNIKKLSVEYFLVKVGSSFTCKEVKVTSIWRLQLGLAAWTLFTGNSNAEQSATALVGAECSPESAVWHMQHSSWVWT